MHNNQGYYAIFKNDSFIRKESLDEAIKVPFCEYVLECELAWDNTTQYGNRYTGYRYKIYDSSGNIAKIRIGDFEIIDISVDSISKDRTTFRNIFVFDHKNQTAHSFVSQHHLFDTFFRGVISFLEGLNSVGSWEAYENKKKLELLKYELESKSQAILELKKTISHLEAELKKLKE